MNEFLDDTWRGLNAAPKYLLSKYFYDEAGDAIFREIMDCPEYYPARCELEILSGQTVAIVNSITGNLRDFDVVELGAGDGTKSVFLLDELLKRKLDFTYYPIDISRGVIRHLTETLPPHHAGLKLQGLNGDYFEMLKELSNRSSRNKVVLFLGSNIGNITLTETVSFFKTLRNFLLPGDLLLTGFDLKKDPQVILAAYNDKAGITRRFNLNLLTRINNTLGADFDITQFAHAPQYDPQTGACESYLVSLSDQNVRIGERGSVNFKEGERIHMEVSQKYTVQQTDEFATASGFKPVHHFYDGKQWFLDALWYAI
jgi:L-histidine Nalpha-methyltransferase